MAISRTTLVSLFEAQKQLVAKHAAVSTAVAWYPFTVWGLRAQHQGALKDLAARIARLDPMTGDMGIAVKDGTLAPEKYRDLLALYWNQVVSIENDAGGAALSFDRVWGEIVVPTMKDAETKLDELKEALPDGDDFKFGAVAIVVVLVLVLAIKVT